MFWVAQGSPSSFGCFDIRWAATILQSKQRHACAGAACIGILNTEDGTCTPLPPWCRRSGPRKTIYLDPPKGAQSCFPAVYCTQSFLLLHLCTGTRSPRKHLPQSLSGALSCSQRCSATTSNSACPSLHLRKWRRFVRNGRVWGKSISA